MSVQTAYILTSHWRDTPQGLNLEFFCATNTSPVKLVFTQQKIVFFILRGAIFSPSSIIFDRKSKKLKNFQHLDIDAIYLSKYKDLNTAQQYCKAQGIQTFEADILPTERFLMERFINAQIELQGDCQSSSNIDTYTNPKIRAEKKNSSFNIPLSSLSLDIETGVKGELYSIGLYFEYQGISKQRVLMLASNSSSIDETLSYFSTEKEILEEFLKTLHLWDPDLIIGWHVIGFDLFFLERKFLSSQLKFNLGRQRSSMELIERKGSGFFARTNGRIVLDGPPILRSAFYKFNDFKLETVAMEVLGTGKDIGSSAEKVLEIERRFKEDKPALAKYNLLDCKLVTQIFNKLNIFDLLIQRTKISGMLIDRLPMSTAAFDHAFLPKLHRKGYIAPNRIDIVREEPSIGAMVIEPKAGLHKNVAIFDFKSLYPSIIMTFLIDPFSKIKNDIQPLKTPKGFAFSKSEHILPNIISELMEKRELAKIKEDSSLSQAIKILMNSFYGVMGSSKCRFYHSDLPTAITTTGHWILKTAMTFFENRGLEIIYGDTDSLFIKLTNEDDSHCRSIAEDLDLYLEKIIYDDFQLQSKLQCEFEKKYEQIFFPIARSSQGAAKKRYAATINNSVEFKGMEFVRSDWTQLAKNFQKELYEKFFAGEKTDSYIKSYIKSLESGLFDDLLVYTRRLSKAPEEYVKNIPIHVKAALKINNKGPYRLKSVSYIMTNMGPEPIESNPRNFDYQHYIEKQLKPIANDILHSQDMSFDSFIMGDQLSFF